MSEDDVRGLLLAGGRSKRMGADKRLLSIGHETLVGRAYGALREVFGPPWVLVAGAEDVDALSPILGAGVRFLADEAPSAGPLSALADALRIVDRTQVFLLAVDMPRVTSTVLHGLDGLRRALPRMPDALVPIASGVPQVTCAFYRRAVAQSMRASVLAGSRSLVDWIGRGDVDARYLEQRELSGLGTGEIFENLNTPADHERYLRERSR